MSTVLHPPAEIGSPESLLEEVQASPEQWFEYISQLYNQNNSAQKELDNAYEDTALLCVRNGILEKENQSLKEQINHQAGVIAYQKAEINEKSENLYSLRAERDRALEAALPSVRTLPSNNSPPAKAVPAPAAAEAPPVAPRSTASTRLSERLPDPAMFKGDRKDFRRFQSKIHQKMKTNADRFPTPAERMSYVTNRLEGPAYAQILPYILDGECQLPDYPDVLRVLERAYGDPNRVNNARKELFRLKQQHKEFAAFYAEFQRLALEGEVQEDSQITILEAALSHELKGQLTSVDAPDHNVHEFAAFLQKLENKRRYYNDLTDSRKPRYNPRQTNYANNSGQSKNTNQTNSDPMDLSTARRQQPKFTPQGRRERGECYRCGSSKHLVAACPEPAPARNPAQLREARVNGSIYSEATRSRKMARSPSPAFTDSSAKEIALA